MKSETVKIAPSPTSTSPNTSTPGDCTCVEGRYEDASGAKISSTIGAHNCGYIERRNALIPEAEKIAGNKDSAGWSVRFMKAMNALARMKGLNK